jgi:hypothetical protein
VIAAAIPPCLRNCRWPAYRSQRVEHGRAHLASQQHRRNCCPVKNRVICCRRSVSRGTPFLTVIAHSAWFAIGFSRHPGNGCPCRKSQLMGAVGLNWQFSGIGKFSSVEPATCSCATQIPAAWKYTTSIAIRSRAPPSVWIGSSRADNFSGNPGKNDLLLRNSRTAGLSLRHRQQPTHRRRLVTAASSVMARAMR